MELKSFLKGLALGLAGKPLEFAPGKEPVAQWETLFDGEVTSQIGYGDISACDVYISKPFVTGDTLRLTVNGANQTLTAIQTKSDETIEQYPAQAIQAYVGNSDVGGGASNGFENENAIDYDYCLLYLKETSMPVDGNPSWCYFYTRTAGTYHLKIERLA